MTPAQLFAHPAAAVLAAATLVLTAAPAAAQTAAVLYERAQAREAALTGRADPPVAELRSVATAYEAIVRRHPTSGYSDNALWQAAGLLEAAFAQSGRESDLDRALALLRWLAREYPHSPLARQAPDRIRTMEAAAAATPETPAPRNEPAAPPAAAAGAAAVRDITYAPLPRGDRITIEVSREVIISGDRIGNPDRVFFDFASADAAASLAARAEKISGRLVSNVRVGRPDAGVTRVVLELTGAPRHSAFPLYGPFRLVVALETDAELPPPPPAVATPDPPVPSGPAPPPPAPPSATSGGDYSLARQLGAGVSRIVIDPGHGGHDPGAIANGVREAELVLDIALRLEKLLEAKPGMDVVLTRRTNEFIPLEERTAIANREAGDLFLSIHANAGRHATARGIETYFLNFATTPDAEAVAARENAGSAQSMGTLPAILKTIALNNKLAESRELASILQTSMVRRLRMHNQAVRDLGVKQAPFVVLIGAQMPSVLAEVSFVTNRAEAALLKQAGYRQQIAQALCDAIVRYQGTLKKITTGTVE